MSKRVAELEGAELDYWVFRAGDPMCAGLVAVKADGDWLLVPEDGGSVCAFISDKHVLERMQLQRAHALFSGCDYRPSRNWNQGGQIIEREQILVNPVGIAGWWADCRAVNGDHSPSHIGPTPLIAAMRAYVASKFGDSVEA